MATNTTTDRDVRAQRRFLVHHLVTSSRVTSSTPKKKPAVQKKQRLKKERDADDDDNQPGTAEPTPDIERTRRHNIYRNDELMRVLFSDEPHPFFGRSGPRPRASGGPPPSD